MSDRWHVVMDKGTGEERMARWGGPLGWWARYEGEVEWPEGDTSRFYSYHPLRWLHPQFWVVNYGGFAYAFWLMARAGGVRWAIRRIREACAS